VKAVPSRAVAALAAIATLAACSEESERWRDALVVLEDGTAVFSFLLVGPPPEGTALRIGIHESRIDDPCRLYRPDAVLGDVTPFWYLLVNVGRSEPGEYGIVTDMNLAPIDVEGEDGGGDRDHAEVILRKIVGNGKTDISMPALGGKVTIVEAPGDVQGWNDGMAANMVIEAEFPAKLVTTLECNGAIGEGGSTFSGWCDCEDEDGEVTQCDLLSSSQETCCYDSDGDRVKFNKEFLAAQCPWMCMWLAGLDGLFWVCHDLQSDH
jgi:hypothetical protein